MNKHIVHELMLSHDDIIFVYGANELGIHGSGAAKDALCYGAKIGKIGFCGRTYGIPTKASPKEKLPLNRIDYYIGEFVHFAASRKDLIFLVTPIGTGLAGYTAEDIAPLFAKYKYDQINNLFLPYTFIKTEPGLPRLTDADIRITTRLRKLL